MTCEGERRKSYFVSHAMRDPCIKSPEAVSEGIYPFHCALDKDELFKICAVIMSQPSLLSCFNISDTPNWECGRGRYK